RACWAETRAFRRAHIIIANSNATKHEVEQCLGDTGALIHTVYLGSDAGVTTTTPEEKSRARSDWKISPTRKVAVFVGALGLDGNKGFDTLFKIWQSLCGGPDWDVDLLVAGAGRALADWRTQVRAVGLGDRIRCLGFCDKIPSLLKAADVLISPVRYEAYGLNVQEAICRGVAALTSARAGIAERYPADLKPMLFENPDDVLSCMERIQLWRSRPESWAEGFLRFGASLRQRDWNVMAAEMVEIIERHCPLAVKSGVASPYAARGAAIAATKPST
ncbi:MAG: glycosyltransferase family 4 protein, partial [Limisphaerales bacterium]